MSIRYKVLPFNDVAPGVLRRLCSLTNDAERGDVRDNGDPSGSLFKRQLDERICGESFPNSTVVLAQEGLSYVGWCMIQRHDLDPDTGRRLSVPSCQVGFYVATSHRRQGLGRCLIEEALEVARKNGLGRMLVNTWNRTSRSFFLSSGFTELEPYVSGFGPGVAAMDVCATETKVRVG